MPREKTSQAEIYHARLNPINPEEAIALEYIRAAEGNGINFKQVVVDAINARAGATPEMFARNGGIVEYAKSTEAMFKQFAEQLIAELRQSGGIQMNNPQSAEEPVSRFAKSFASGLRKRQAEGHTE